MHIEVIEKAFTVSAPARLSLSNIRGSVVIRPAKDGQDKIVVEAAKHTDSGNPERTKIEMSQSADGAVTVKTRFEEPDPMFFLFGMRLPCKVDYIVSVPAACSVELRCVSSTGLVEGLQGEFRLKSISGRLTANHLEGTLEIDTVSGNVEGQELSGPARLKTVSARIRIADASFPTLLAKSVSGAITLQTNLGEGPYEFKTVSGNVELTIPAGAGCSLAIHRLSGRLYTDLPITHRTIQTTGEEAAIQGGGAPVSFRTTSGDLRITAYSAGLIAQAG